MGSYIVNGTIYSPDDFAKLSESINNDPTKKLKEISPGVYTVLHQMQG